MEMYKTSDLREMYIKLNHVSKKTGKPYSKWHFMGWYPPKGQFIKTVGEFDYYQEANDLCKYRKLESELN